MHFLKRVAGLFLAMLLCFGIIPVSVLAADGTGGLDNFAKKNVWTDSLFEDVAETDWFCDNIRSVYEYGLMVGKGEGHGYIKSITNEILKAVGTERDPDRACRMNTDYAVRELRQLFPGIEVTGAIYDIRTGEVEWLPGPTQESSL